MLFLFNMCNLPIPLTVQLMHIPERNIIRHIKLECRLQTLSCFGILSGMHIKKCQKLICLQERRMCHNHLFQLDDRKIFSILSAVSKTLVVFVNCLIHFLQLTWIILNLTDIVAGNIL